VYKARCAAAGKPHVARLLRELANPGIVGHEAFIKTEYRPSPQDEAGQKAVTGETVAVEYVFGRGFGVRHSSCCRHSLSFISSVLPVYWNEQERCVEIYKEFSFEAAHHLPNVPEGHKCGRFHGHAYTVRVHLSGDTVGDEGWIMDFADFKREVEPVLEQLDHHYLNDVEGLENPTCEAMCRWLWRRLAPRLPGLCKIVVNENVSSGCIYRGEHENNGSA
jgi:6-pyruvoyltetrahydropterin/6-carboxytetrahydropterin synthase